jgi:hypothetical protein
MASSAGAPARGADAIDVRDASACKATLDELAIELMKKNGYEIDYRLADLESVLAIIAYVNSDPARSFANLRETTS